jgi:hypothetical protein
VALPNDSCASGAGFAQREDFGVRGGIGLRDGRIEAAPDDLAIQNHNGAHGDFAVRFGLARQR